MDKSFQSQDFILPILVSQESERQSYIFDLIFKELIGIDYVLIEKPLAQKYLSYGEKGGIWSHSYLYETSALFPSFEVGDFEKVTLPFFHKSNNYIFPFDPFSICFYFVSRHEEYFSKDLDIHGRYKPENSWLFNNGWQFEPIVNWLTSHLKKWIESFFEIKLTIKASFKVEATLDIDNAYAFYGREKSIFKSVSKSLLQGKWRDALLKYKSSKDKTYDPFNTHAKICEIFSLRDIKPSVFFLMKSGGNNANNSVDVVEEIVKLYSEKDFIVGIHPSYASTWEELEKEKQALEKFNGKEVNISRHHFIKINPTTDYTQLSTCGIERDFSMGYGNANGFRAGICNSYTWFDLENNKKTDLEVVPFYFMDATFIFKLKYSYSQALDEASQITEVVKKYQGTLSFIFHNESISDYEVYKSWGNMLEQTLDLI